MAIILPRRFKTQPQIVAGPANANIRTLVNYAHNGRYARDVAGNTAPTLTAYTDFTNIITTEGRGLASGNGSGAVLHFPTVNAKAIVCVGGIYESGSFPIISIQNAPGSTYRCGFYRSSTGFLAFGANGAEAISNIAPMLSRSYKMAGLIFPNRIEFWVDGSLAATGTPAADVTLTTPQLILGRGTYPNSGFFGGGFVCAAAALADIPDVGGDILSAQPWGYLFKEPLRRLWAEVPAGGAMHALDGAAQADASATGDLTTQIALTGAAQSLAAGTGELTARINLAADGVSIASAAGGLTTQILLSGNALAQAISAAALSSGIALSAAAVAEASASGMLDTVIRLIGAASVQASASGALTTGSASSMEASAQAVATAAGDLTTLIRLDAAALAQAIAAAELSTGIILAADARSVASGTGSLTTAAGGDPLQGQAVAQASGSGVLTTEIRLSVAAAAEAIATGTLIVPVELSAIAHALASATGNLSTDINLAASAESRASATGSLTAGALYQAARLTTHHALSGARLRSRVRLLN